MVCAFPSVFNGPGAETGFHLIMMWDFLGQYNRGNRSKEIEGFCKRLWNLSRARMDARGLRRIMENGYRKNELSNGGSTG